MRPSASFERINRVVVQHQRFLNKNEIDVQFLAQLLELVIGGTVTVKIMLDYFNVVIIHFLTGLLPKSVRRVSCLIAAVLAGHLAEAALWIVLWQFGHLTAATCRSSSHDAPSSFCTWAALPYIFWPCGRSSDSFSTT